MNRRDFLIATGAAGIVTSPLGLAAPAIAKNRPKLVVVGAGYGGATFARYLKLWEPRFDVTLIEPDDKFVSCPMSNTVIGGLNEVRDITFPYDYIKAKVDRFVRDTVFEIYGVYLKAEVKVWRNAPEAGPEEVLSGPPSRAGRHPRRIAEREPETALPGGGA